MKTFKQYLNEKKISKDELFTKWEALEAEYQKLKDEPDKEQEAIDRAKKRIQEIYDTYRNENGIISGIPMELQATVNKLEMFLQQYRTISGIPKETTKQRRINAIMRQQEDIIDQYESRKS